MQAKFLEVVRQGRARDPQLSSNSSLGGSILEGDVPQFIAELFQVDSFPARISTTFIAQAWGSDVSVLLLLVSFPHGRNLLARASKLLRDSIDVPMGQLAILLPSRSSSITARLSFSFRFFLLTVPAVPLATDMVIRVWESNLPEILLSEL